MRGIILAAVAASLVALAGCEVTVTVRRTPVESAGEVDKERKPESKPEKRGPKNGAREPGFWDRGY